MTKQKPTSVDVALGRVIRRERKNRGLSQTDLGADLGVAYQQVQKYERGTNRVSVGNFFEIARALNFTAEELMTRLADEIADMPDPSGCVTPADTGVPRADGSGAAATQCNPSRTLTGAPAMAAAPLSTETQHEP